MPITATVHGQETQQLLVDITPELLVVANELAATPELTPTELNLLKTLEIPDNGECSESKN